MRGKIRAIRRHLFNLASAVSLLLCVATVVLWTLSRKGVDIGIPLGDPRNVRYSVGTEADSDNLVFVKQKAFRDITPEDDDNLWRFVYDWRTHRIGVRLCQLKGVRNIDGKLLAGTQTDLEVWLGWPLLMTLPLPLWKGRSLRLEIQRKKRIRQGLCLMCGYSLSGNISGVCPECGTEAGTQIESPDATFRRITK